MPSLSSIVFLLLFLTFLVPPIQQRLLAARRYRAIRRLEQLRGSRVITLIHRQESVALLGIPIRRFIDVEDSLKDFGSNGTYVLPGLALNVVAS